MTSGQKAAQTRRENKASRERLDRCKEALAEEVVRVNRVIRHGVVIVLKTGFGPYQLDGVSRVDGMDYTTHPAETTKSWSNTRTFMGCNDGQWAEIMRQAGEGRNPLFR
jgi:hypothetical protein